MLPDIRLDFIQDIDEDFIVMMRDMREKFIALDDSIKLIGCLKTAEIDGVGRCLSLARTNLEISLQYIIKSLCLMGEMKE